MELKICIWLELESCEGEKEYGLKKKIVFAFFSPGVSGESGKASGWKMKRSELGFKSDDKKTGLGRARREGSLWAAMAKMKERFYMWHQFVGIQKREGSFGKTSLKWYLLSEVLKIKWIWEFQVIEAGWTFLWS